jgi:hypothetical protein
MKILGKILPGLAVLGLVLAATGCPVTADRDHYVVGSFRPDFPGAEAPSLGGGQWRLEHNNAAFIFNVWDLDENETEGSFSLSSIWPDGGSGTLPIPTPIHGDLEVSHAGTIPVITLTWERSIGGGETEEIVLTGTFVLAPNNRSLTITITNTSPSSFDNPLPDLQNWTR